MESWQVTLITAVLSAIAAMVGTIVTARYTFLGRLYERLARVEEDEKKCRAEVFEMRSEMQTIYFINDVLAQKCPEVDDEVQEIRERIARRRTRFAEKFGDAVKDTNNNTRS